MAGRTNNKVLGIPNGTPFGLWTTIEPVNDRWDYILCKCRCGKEKQVNVYSLTSGKSKSCGCESISLRRKSQELYNGSTGSKSEAQAVRDINHKRRGK